MRIIHSGPPPFESLNTKIHTFPSQYLKRSLSAALSQTKKYKKVKVNPTHAMKACTGSVGRGLFNPNIGTRKRRVFSVMTRPPSLWEKRLRSPVNRKVGGPRIRSGRCRDEIQLLPLPAYEPQIVQPVAYSLYFLRYIGIRMHKF